MSSKAQPMPVLPDAPAHDPKPEPPQAPEPGDCCQSGCIPCVYDFYDEALEHYREQLRAWNERHGFAR